MVAIKVFRMQRQRDKNKMMFITLTSKNSAPRAHAQTSDYWSGDSEWYGRNVWAKMLSNKNSWNVMDSSFCCFFLVQPQVTAKLNKRVRHSLALDQNGRQRKNTNVSTHSASIASISSTTAKGMHIVKTEMRSNKCPLIRIIVPTATDLMPFGSNAMHEKSNATVTNMCVAITSGIFKCHSTCN